MKCNQLMPFLKNFSVLSRARRAMNRSSKKKLHFHFFSVVQEIVYFIPEDNTLFSVLLREIHLSAV